MASARSSSKAGTWILGAIAFLILLGPVIGPILLATNVSVTESARGFTSSNDCGSVFSPQSPPLFGAECSSARRGREIAAIVLMVLGLIGWTGLAVAIVRARSRKARSSALDGPSPALDERSGGAVEIPDDGARTGRSVTAGMKTGRGSQESAGPQAERSTRDVEEPRVPPVRLRCATCGEQLRPGARFCPACGVAVAENSPSADPTGDHSAYVRVSAPSAEGHVGIDASPTDASREQERPEDVGVQVGQRTTRHRTTAWVAIAAISVAGLVVGGLALTGVFGGGGSSPPSHASSGGASASVGGWGATYRTSFITACASTPVAGATPAQVRSMCECAAAKLAALYPNDLTVPTNVASTPPGKQIVTQCIPQLMR